MNTSHMITARQKKLKIHQTGPKNVLHLSLGCSKLVGVPCLKETVLGTWVQPAVITACHPHPQPQPQRCSKGFPTRTYKIPTGSKMPVRSKFFSPKEHSQTLPWFEWGSQMGFKGTPLTLSAKINFSASTASVLRAYHGFPSRKTPSKNNVS